MMEMKCENHPDLRWLCKMQAVSRSGRYTGARNIFFLGKVLDNGRCVEYDKDTGTMYRECPCPGADLIATDMEAVESWHKAEDNFYGRKS